MAYPTPAASAFRPVPRTGVIYVTSEAERRGYHFGHPDWCNLGQGQPETSVLPGAPPRVEHVLTAATEDYAPVGGLWELREAVATLYNRLYRRGLGSQYTAENVAISGGGRVALMRVCASIGPVHMGHFLPDYTAYAELLDIFRRFSPIPILLDPERGYDFGPDELRREILGRGLGALLFSNPCNPTGKVVHGERLDAWVSLGRELDCTLLIDEFYSHYLWGELPSMVSAAAHVKDVERDPVILVDGLTKNWRYPGWRIAWIVGPQPIIEAATSAGSFLDGSASHPMQRAALALVDADVVTQETRAIRAAFAPKRTRLLEGLRRLGVTFDLEPEGTFYLWGDLSGLPASLRACDDFFDAALERQVIVVPGEFFDVDPGKRRGGRSSRFHHHARFSFGPPAPVLEVALERLEAMIREAH